MYRAPAIMDAAAAGRRKPAAPDPVPAADARLNTNEPELEGFRMHRILIVTPDRKPLSAFAESLEESQEVQVAWAETGQAAITDITRHPPLGVIINEDLLDMPGLDLVRRLLPINAFINTVMISDLPAETFHEAGEGLGILAQLPSQPTPSDADAILALLKRMSPFSCRPG
jgi:CheY-like chemotaxis protein